MIHIILRFIGTDGSMELRHGHVYEVKINIHEEIIWLEIYMGFYRKIHCPYESLNAFAKNWELPKANSCSISSDG